METRICKICKQEKPITEFKPYGDGKRYFTSCNCCKNEGTSKFKDFESRELITELRARGYKGKLVKTITKEVVL